MTGLNHTVTGALVAAAINRPVIALPAALLSHFVIDMLPHWNHTTSAKTQKLVDRTDLALTIIAIIALSLLLKAPAWIIVAGACLGVFPDMMWLPEILQSRPAKLEGQGWFYKLRQFHHKIQWSETDTGKYYEAIWFLFLILIAVIYKK